MAISFQVCLACVGLASALWLSGRPVPPLPAEQQHLAGLLARGRDVVSAGCLGMSILAIASLFGWRQGIPVRQAMTTAPPVRHGWGWRELGVAALLGLCFGMLALPRMSTAFWWDELSTLIRVVRRGPLVIMTFACDANNHVLNSALIWGAMQVFGEREFVARLPAFLFGLALVQSVYWYVLRNAHFRVAALCGLLMAMHPWVVNHSVEARGYSGAMFMTWICMVLFPRLLLRGSVGLAIAYMAAGTAAFGFLATSILAPLTHGIIATGIMVATFFRSDWQIAWRRNSLNLMFACLWTAVLSLIGFGFMLPQTIEYARTMAIRSHLPFGLPLLADLFRYLSGYDRGFPLALAVGLLACTGWTLAFRATVRNDHDRLLTIGVLAPMAMGFIYIGWPGNLSSARLLFFLIPGLVMGMAAGCSAFFQARAPYRIAVGVVLLAVLAMWGMVHQNLLTVNQPDLKSLAAELAGQKVALVGAQSDLNVYYFPEALIGQRRVAEPLDVIIRDAQFVVEGRVVAHGGRIRENAGILDLGFHPVRTLHSAIPGRTEYVLYERTLRPSR